MPLLRVVPSKSDRERVLLVSPDSHTFWLAVGSPGKLLPYRTEIVDIVKDKGWISVSALMATQQSTMVTEGKHSPVEWFRRGGDVDALARIIEGQKWR